MMTSDFKWEDVNSPISKDIVQVEDIEIDEDTNDE